MAAPFYTLAAERSPGAALRSVLGSEPTSELGPGPNADLPVDPREVPFDRLHGQEELVGDLLVRPAVRDQGGDALFGGGQGCGRRGPPSDPRELARRPLAPRRRPEGLETIEGTLESLPSGPLLPASSQDGPEGQERPRAFERQPQLVEVGDRVLTRADALVRLPGSGREQSAAARGHGRSPSPAELVRSIEEGVGQLACALEIACGDERLDRVAEVAQHSRLEDPHFLDPLHEGLEPLDGLLELTVRQVDETQDVPI